jgi:outer membrane receptor protein involved in Fe transport
LGQSITSFKGNVYFKNSLISDAQIEFYENGKLLASSISDKNGAYFIYKIISNGKSILIKISHIQYKSEEILIKTESSNIVYDLHFLEEATLFLDEVVINKKEKFIRHDADKSVVMVRNNDLLSSGSTFEAIAKLPGVVITNEGMIGLNGTLATIFIDGEPTGISGENLSTFLNSLPANSIDRIELIQNPGAKYSASFSGGIINIITNTTKSEGYNVTINSNSRVNHNLKTGHSLQVLLKKNSLNYDLVSGYNNNNANREEEFITNLENQSNFKIIEKRQPVFHYEGFYLRNKIRYTLSKKTSVVFNFNHNKNRSNNNLQNTNLNSSLDPNSNSQTQNFQRNQNINNEFILKLKHDIDTLGSNIELSFYKNNFNSDSQSKLSEISTTSRYSRILFNSFTNNQNVRLDAEFPLKKINSTFYFGSTLGRINAENEGKYNLNSTTSAIFASENFQTSIPFVFENTNFAFYNSFSTKINKLHLSLGLRYENIKYENFLKNQAEQLNQTTFSNFFPNLNVLYKYNDFINFSSNYNRKINLPSSNNFDPNFNQASFYYNDVGNPLLNAEISNNYNAKITFFDYAYLGYYISYLSHRNVPFYQSNSDSIGVTQTLFSLENTYNQTLNLGIPIPYALFTEGLSLIDKKDSLDINNISYLFVDMSFNRLMFNNPLYKQFEDGNFMVYLYSQIILGRNLKMFFNYNFTSKGSTGVYNLVQPITNLDIHFSTKLLKKKLRADFGVYNLLNTSGYELSFKGENMSSYFRRINETRMFKFSLTYNFGSFANNQKEDFKENKLDPLGN